MSFTTLRSGCQQAGWSDEQEGVGARRSPKHRHGGAQEGEGEQEAAAGAESREGETQQHPHQIPKRADGDAGGQYTHTANNKQQSTNIYKHVLKKQVFLWDTGERWIFITISNPWLCRKM